MQWGWSQEQLAEMSGLSVRTVQRAERGKSSSLKTLKALAAVFEVDAALLREDETVTENSEKISAEEGRVLRQVNEIKGLYTHLIQFAVIVSALGFINYMPSPGRYWIFRVIIGWGAGIIAHGLTTFEVVNLLGAKWEHNYWMS